MGRALTMGCRWMEACIGCEISSASAMENELRNGVYAARLAHFFAPKVVQMKNIYDADLAIYSVCDVMMDGWMGGDV